MLTMLARASAWITRARFLWSGVQAAAAISVFILCPACVGNDQGPSCEDVLGVIVRVPAARLPHVANVETNDVCEGRNLCDGGSDTDAGTCTEIYVTGVSEGTCTMRISFNDGSTDFETDIRFGASGGCCTDHCALDYPKGSIIQVPNE